MTPHRADEMDHKEDATTPDFITGMINPPSYMNGNTKNNLDENIQSSFNHVVKHQISSSISFLKYCLIRPYIVFWHELCVDPKVRRDPWSPPPENEILLTKSQVSVARQRRIYFLSIHILACVGLYYCLAGKVGIYTGLWASSGSTKNDQFNLNQRTPAVNFMVLEPSRFVSTTDPKFWVQGKDPVYTASFYALFLGVISLIGVTAGAHRLWSHHSYKATWQLRLILAIFQTVGLQFSILMWVKDHRVHHKFSDTDADPHNSKRGFFFSHIGWLLSVPHSEFLKNKKRVDTSDVEKDWVVKYQHKYYFYLSMLFCYIIPTVVPWYFWNEEFWAAHLVACHLRHVLSLHGEFTINSVAHMFGTRPYDKNICPTENMLVSVTTMGDGWHNYHHAFPWDYKNAELWNYKLNVSGAFVDLFAAIGWAYDLKIVSREMIAKRVKKAGDGTHPLHHCPGGVWGWNDKDVTNLEKSMTVITHRKISDTE